VIEQWSAAGRRPLGGNCDGRLAQNRVRAGLEPEPSAACERGGASRTTGASPVIFTSSGCEKEMAPNMEMIGYLFFRLFIAPIRWIRENRGFVRDILLGAAVLLVWTLGWAVAAHLFWKWTGV
jgi:hypothetical protein